jgi:hypothetical protein
VQKDQPVALEAFARDRHDVTRPHETCVRATDRAFGLKAP